MKKIAIAVILVAIPVLADVKPKPAEVKVVQVNDRRAKGSFSELRIQLQLPKVMSSDVAASRVLVTRAVDDTGGTLVDPAAEEPQLETNHSSAMMGGEAPPPRPVTVAMLLKNPPRKATQVKEVAGEIELYMPSKDPNSTADIAKFQASAGKPLAHKALKANGVEITVVSAAQIDAEKKARADAKRKEAKESGYDDADVDEMVKNFLENLFNVDESEMLVSIKDPKKRIQSIAYVDAKGEEKHISMSDDEGYTKLSTWGDKLEPDWKLRVTMKTDKNTVRQSFALKDVPLP